MYVIVKLVKIKNYTLSLKRLEVLMLNKILRVQIIQDF